VQELNFRSWFIIHFDWRLLLVYSFLPEFKVNGLLQSGHFLFFSKIGSFESLLLLLELVVLTPQILLQALLISGRLSRRWLFFFRRRRALFDGGFGQWIAFVKLEFVVFVLSGWQFIPKESEYFWINHLRMTFLLYAAFESFQVTKGELDLELVALSTAFVLQSI
jgi:hypothetical protein